jgi:hypothetical protein
VLQIRDVYPGFLILIFTHPGSRIQKLERGEKKICWHKPQISQNCKLFYFKMLKKKIWANFQRIIELFTQKIVTKLSKIWVWDPGSGKNLFRIPDPGVKKAPDPGSGSATLTSRVVDTDSVNPDPETEPIQIQGFDSQKLKKKTAENIFYLF